MKRIALCLLALLALTLTAYSQQTKRVLFVGNSYTSVNNLPQLIAQIVESTGEHLIYDAVTPGGCTFSQHCNGQAMQLIRQGGWDAVVLQEQSQLPSFPDDQVAYECLPYAQRLVDSIYAHGYCTEPIFYMTWGRKNGDQTNAPYFPPLGSYEGMDSLLALRYTLMAESGDASLCPVGRVWHHLRTEHPEIELYQSDESHPSMEGSYAAACAFYTILFRADPMAIGFNSTLAPSTAQTLREVVRTVVFDSLAHWLRPEPSFQYTLIDTITASNVFAASIEEMQTDTLLWQWGDGSDTIVPLSILPLVRHEYADSGWFDIQVDARRHCRSSQTAITFHSIFADTTSEGIHAPSAQRLTLSPNPAHSEVQLQADEPILSLELMDAQGRTVEQHAPITPELRLRTAHLPSGMYLLRVRTRSATGTHSLLVRH